MLGLVGGACLAAAALLSCELQALRARGAMRRKRSFRVGLGWVGGGGGRWGGLGFGWRLGFGWV